MKQGVLVHDLESDRRVTRQEMFGINRALLVSLDLNTSSRQ